MDLLLISGLVKSKGEAKRLIKGSGAKVNDSVITDENQLYTTSDFLKGERLKISVGKKRHIVLKF